MNFDGLTLHKVIENIKPQIVRKRLNNIYNPLKAEYNFHIRDKILLISVSPNHGRIYFTTFIKTNPSKPSTFTMVMRKYVKKAIILDIKTMGYDRTIKFDFRGRGELGEEKIISLYVELMGKYSNMILVDGKKIIDSHRRIVTKYRKILPNKEYIPFTSDKNPPEHYLDHDKFLKEFSNSKNYTSAILSKIQGFSPKVSKFISKDVNDPANLYERYCFYIEDYLNKAGLYFSDNEVFPIAFPNTIYDENLSERLEKIYVNIEKEEINRNKKHRFYLKIEDEIKKLERDIENLNSDLEETENYEIFRKYGELLQIYQSQIKNKNPILEDYETGKKIEVPLIKRKNALESSLEYFKKYNKFKRRREFLSSRIKKLKKRLDRANEVLLHVELASTQDDLKELKMEFEAFGLPFKSSLKKRKSNGRKKVSPKSLPKKYKLENSILYIGKNSFQNEFLYRNSPKNSLWLHVKDTPSSHGILIGNVNKATLKTAAEIVAYHSKARLSSKVKVDYTNLSNVWKPKGAVKGFVLYKNYKTIIVDPNEHTELLENNKI